MFGKSKRLALYSALSVPLLAVLAFVAMASADGPKGSGESRADASEGAIKNGLAPNFELKNPAGKTFKLSESLAKGPVILAFYRGGWCPFCNKQLHDLQSNLPEFKKLGAELVAISPQTPEKTEWTETKNQLTFTVLSDPDNGVAKKYGLVYKVGAPTTTMYKAMGIDLEKTNGAAVPELPLPATYLVKQDGQIAYSFVDEDFKKRANSADLLTALTKIKKTPLPN